MRALFFAFRPPLALRISESLERGTSRSLANSTPFVPARPESLASGRGGGQRGTSARVTASDTGGRHWQNSGSPACTLRPRRGSRPFSDLWRTSAALRVFALPRASYPAAIPRRRDYREGGELHAVVCTAAVRAGHLVGVCPLGSGTSVCRVHPSLPPRGRNGWDWRPFSELDTDDRNCSSLAGRRSACHGG